MRSGAGRYRLDVRRFEIMPRASPYSFYEFFAGGGMARAGLGSGWSCLFANDFDPLKTAAYARNWGSTHLSCADVASLQPESLPGVPELIWASFPCQDLSLAGDRRGLGGLDRTPTRSGAFWPFWRLVTALREEGRGPRLVVLENVVGLLTSDQGRDFQALAGIFAETGYRFGALVLDARWFVPQSRPRVFLVAVDARAPIRAGLTSDQPDELWAPDRLRAAHARLDPALKPAWLWWRLARPDVRPARFADLLEAEPAHDAWHAPHVTQRLLDSMAPANRCKVEAARRVGSPSVGTLYRRTRPTPDGGRIVRAEVRFDDIAGCLRTPAGGSSRQQILVVDDGRVRSRLISAREAARLMGLADAYRLPERASDAYHLLGDGVVVDVVRHLAAGLLEPLLDEARSAVP